MYIEYHEKGSRVNLHTVTEHSILLYFYFVQHMNSKIRKAIDSVSLLHVSGFFFKSRLRLNKSHSIRDQIVTHPRYISNNFVYVQHGHQQQYQNYGPTFDVDRRHPRHSFSAEEVFVGDQNNVRLYLIPVVVRGRLYYISLHVIYEIFI